MTSSTTEYAAKSIEETVKNLRCDIAMIWAMSTNKVIGLDNTLPWRLPKDLKNFMAVTMNKPVIMGRKTLESMKSPLPGRTNIVLTRDRTWQRPGVTVAHDFAEALLVGEKQCQLDGENEIMVIGGADIYALALPYAHRLYVTHVHANIEGDVFFPTIDLEHWQLQEEAYVAADERHSADFTLAVYTKPSTAET